MPSRSGDLALLLAILAVVAGTIALAQILPAAAPKGSPSTAAYGEREATCAEWTDGCIVCLRGASGPSCSTPGIACVRGPVQCVRRDGI